MFSFYSGIFLDVSLFSIFLWNSCWTCKTSYFILYFISPSYLLSPFLCLLCSGQFPWFFLWAHLSSLSNLVFKLPIEFFKWWFNIQAVQWRCLYMWVYSCDCYAREKHISSSLNSPSMLFTKFHINGNMPNVFFMSHSLSFEFVNDYICSYFSPRICGVFGHSILLFHLVFCFFFLKNFLNNFRLAYFIKNPSIRSYI